MSEDWRKKAQNSQEFWEEKNQKAKKLWDNELWSEYFRIAYIAFEKKVELLYIHENRQIIPEDSDINNIIATMSRKYNIDLMDQNQFHNWRKIRNEIAHIDREIDQNTAKRAKQFFDEINKTLDNLLEKYIQPKFEYNGIPMVQDDFNLLKEIEKLVGTPLTNYTRYGFKDLFGFSQDEGFLTILAIDGRKFDGNMEILPRPEFLEKVYIHGDNFLKFADWLKEIIKSPNLANKQKTMVIRIIEGEKWSQNIRSEAFTHFCSIKQIRMAQALKIEDIFLNLKITEIKKKILEISKKFGRIYIDELVELLNIDNRDKIGNKYQDRENKALIITTIQDMLANREIKGHFFNFTSVLAFDLSK